MMLTWDEQKILKDVAKGFGRWVRVYRLLPRRMINGHWSRWGDYIERKRLKRPLYDDIEHLSFYRPIGSTFDVLANSVGVYVRTHPSAPWEPAEIGIHEQIAMVNDGGRVASIDPDADLISKIENL